MCLFSYGQTGAGKTHTMQGSKGADGQGIIPRAILKVCFSDLDAACIHTVTSDNTTVLFDRMAIGFDIGASLTCKCSLPSAEGP